MLEHALQWRDRGYVPVPMVYRSKQPRFAWGQWLVSDDVPADAVMEIWFAGMWNIGVVLRGADLVVDFDDMAKYREWREKYGVKAMTTMTSRGAHVWMRCRTETMGLKVEGADLLRRHLVVVPPSVHPRGAKYELIDGPIPEVDEVPGAVLREDVVERVERRPRIADVMGTDSAIAAIKKLVPMEMYLRKITVVGKGNGRHIKAVCPLHNDHNPSMLIDMQTDRCKCFAGCTDGWIDIIDLRMRRESISTQVAIWRFASELGF